MKTLTLNYLSMALWDLDVGLGVGYVSSFSSLRSGSIQAHRCAIKYICKQNAR